VYTAKSTADLFFASYTQLKRIFEHMLKKL
jgi:hypothetical protein